MTPAQCRVLHAGSIGLKVFRSNRRAAQASKTTILVPKRTIDAMVRKGLLQHAEGFNEYEPSNDGLDRFVKMRKDWTYEALT